MTVYNPVVIFASTKKEAIAHALKEYGEHMVYVKPYKYASKGNNFYEFTIISYPED